MAVVLETGQSTAHWPDFAVHRDTLYGCNGRDANWAYAGDTLRRAGVRGPAVRRDGAKDPYWYIGANYDPAVDGQYIQLDAGASGTDAYYVGCVMEVNDGTNIEHQIITGYTGSTKKAKLKAALSNSYTAAATKYCLHERFTLSADNGSYDVTAGDHYVLVTLWDSDHDVESDPTELLDHNFWETRDFNKLTAVSGDRIKVEWLPKPRDSHATHWRFYMTVAGGDTYYRVAQQKIGTWDGSKSKYLNMDDTELAEQPELSARRSPFYTMRNIGAGKTRLFMSGQVTYSTGTVAITNGARSATLTGGTWTDAFEDLEIVIDTDDETPSTQRYTIVSVEDSTHLTLDRAFVGSTQTAATYCIIGYARTIFFSEVDLDGTLAPENTSRPYNQIELGMHAGETERGIFMMGEGDQLLFTEISIHRLSGEDKDSFDSPAYVAGLGAVSHRTIINVEGLILALTPFAGVWGTTGYGELEEASKVCPTLFDDTTLAMARLKNACAAYDTTNRIAHFSVTPIGATANREWRNFFVKTKAWTRYDLVDAQAMAELEDNNGLKEIYYLDSVGFLIKANQQLGDKVQCSIRRGVATAGSTTSLTDSEAAFTATKDGEKGVWVTLLTGDNAELARRIYSNTATALTLAQQFSSAIAVGDVYHLGCIHIYIETGWLDLSAQTRWSPSDYKNWHKLFLHCAEQDADYTTGKMLLTNGQTAVTGVDTVWTSSHRGLNLYVPGEHRLHYVSAVGGNTALTLNSAWGGRTGGHAYKLGARVWKVRVYTDYDSDTVQLTRYVDMADGIAEMLLGFRAQTAKFKIETWDDPTAIANPIIGKALEFDITR